MNNINETLLSKIRSKLRLDNIKLWLTPFTMQDESQSEAHRHLVLNYSKDLSQSESVVFLHIEHLRIFSLQKLSQNAKFKDEGIATLRLKFAPRSAVDLTLDNIQVKLEVTTNNLVEEICNKTNISPGCVKLIYNGKVLLADQNLVSQGVNHNKTILCMIYSKDAKTKTKEIEKQMLDVRTTRRGAELLASSNSAIVDQYDPQITDQNGRTIDLPPEEKAALTIALSLHDKGRNYLEKKHYSFAILFFMEADMEFSQCSAEILNMVDNYAVLCLDIAWCYLCLKNLDILHDASERLGRSEEVFKKSYGESLQRLLTIKGTSHHEVALFVRLYLLQGIVEYFQGNYKSSLDLLNKALGFAQSIKVDEEKLTEMVALGFKEGEARLALRACSGNIASASQYAFKKQEEKKKIREDEEDMSRKRKLARSLGKCANGNMIDVDLFETMTIKLGFGHRLAAEALKQCNNNLDQAMQVIQDNGEHLLENTSKQTITDELIQQVSAVGFDPTSARAALHHFNGDATKSVEYLSSHGGTVPPKWLFELNEDLKYSPSSTASLSKQDKSALKKLAKTVDHHNDYLDITLDEELGYIAHYLALTQSVME